MIRIIVLAIAALAIVAGSASASGPWGRIGANGTHVDGLRTGISAGVVDAIGLAHRRHR